MIERAAGVRRRRLGALRPRPTGRRRTTSPPSSPRSSPSSSALFLDRGGQVQRPAARRPPGRALQLRPRRAADADPRQLAAPVRRHGPTDRERRPEPEEQVALGDGRDRRSRGRRHRRAHRRRAAQFGGWSLYLKDGEPRYAYNFFGIQRLHGRGLRRGAAGRAPGADGVRLRRRRARARAARCGSTSTASSRARAASRRRSRCSSRATRRPTSAATPARR